MEQLSGTAELTRGRYYLLGSVAALAVMSLGLVPGAVSEASAAAPDWARRHTCAEQAKINERIKCGESSATKAKSTPFWGERLTCEQQAATNPNIECASSKNQQVAPTGRERSTNSRIPSWLERKSCAEQVAEGKKSLNCDQSTPAEPQRRAADAKSSNSNSGESRLWRDFFEGRVTQAPKYPKPDTVNSGPKSRGFSSTVGWGPFISNVTDTRGSEPDPKRVAATKQHCSSLLPGFHYVYNPATGKVEEVLVTDGGCWGFDASEGMYSKPLN